MAWKRREGKRSRLRTDVDRVAAIVVGAGSAERMGTDKIFVAVGGETSA